MAVTVMRTSSSTVVELDGRTQLLAMSTVVEYNGGMTAKTRDGEVTRARILAAARAQFGRTASNGPPSARSRRRRASTRHWSCTTSATRPISSRAVSRLDIIFPDLSGVAPERRRRRAAAAVRRGVGSARPVPAAAARGATTNRRPTRCSTSSSSRWRRRWPARRSTGQPSGPRSSARRCWVSRSRATSSASGRWSIWTIEPSRRGSNPF